MRWLARAASAARCSGDEDPHARPYASCLRANVGADDSVSSVVHMGGRPRDLAHRKWKTAIFRRCRPLSDFAG
eukprot:4900744-Pyramimonas_sp.AAC.1